MTRTAKQRKRVVRRRLRQHQRAAFAYARVNAHPALFMEMRLGKTLVALRTIKLYRPRRQTGLTVLVVAPNSALGGWQDELALEGEDDVALLVGKKDKRLQLLNERHKWSLINKEGFIAIPHICTILWDAVVLDESTFIKNPRAKVTKFFLRNFRTVPHRWILTGTPNPESSMEFWPQLAFLDGRAFGFKNFWQFRASRYQTLRTGYDWMPKLGTDSLIHKAVGRRTFILQRRDVNLENERVYETRYLQLPGNLQSAYRIAEEEFILEGPKGEVARTFTAGVIYSWLRQMCGGFMDNESLWAGKEDELIRMLEGELRREPVVVWFCFNNELHSASAALKARGISHYALTGKTPPAERYKLFRGFQDGKVRVILLQEAIAQFGVDLSRADTAIYFSSPTSYLLRRQTEDRIVKVGKTTPLLYLDLIVEKTVDADLHTALHDKKVTSEVTLRLALLAAFRERARGGKG
jgi:SNF2 family DNA or RNA helicase